jgi:PAS domain S-box-containing protein
VDTQFVDLVLKNIADGVFTVNCEFIITYFNRAAEQITGYSSQEAVGRSCSEIFRTAICQQDCPMRQSIRTGRTVKNFEIDVLHRRGSQQTISVSTAPLVDEAGRFLGGVETFRHLAPLKELRQEISGKYAFQKIISKNAHMRQIFETMPNISQSDATVLIQGRSGTGKELFATAIHNLSPRAEGPLVKVNCGALPETLLESELFGYVKGAFTDAKQNRIGRFQAAQGGTIFLDEIGDTPLSVQVKLLRVLQHREFEPLGSERTIKADVRVVAATNQELEVLVSEGRFREDLYYRLNVILIRIPDLNQRVEDIPILMEHFLERFNRRMGRSISGITEEALAILVRYPFPGNVRELENVMEHAYIVTRGPRITPEDLPPYLLKTRRMDPPVSRRPWPGMPSWDLSGADGERQRLIDCLQRNYWNIPRAAQELGMHRTTLWRKVKRHDIRRS